MSLSNRSWQTTPLNIDMPSNTWKLHIVLTDVTKEVLSVTRRVRPNCFPGSGVNGACSKSALQHCWLEGQLPTKLRVAVCCMIHLCAVKYEVQPETPRDVVTKHMADATWGPSCCSTGSGNNTTKITSQLFVQNTLLLRVFRWSGWGKFLRHQDRLYSSRNRICHAPDTVQGLRFS
jgi:hypothetical protein